MVAPELIIVGGPNGSGKSTFAMKHSANSGLLYVGADQIAYQLSPEDPASARIEASRKFISTIRDAIKNRESLIIESTLAGKSLRNMIGDAKSVGYRISIVFVFLDSGDACVHRVQQRVQLGGHDVPESDIRRRFRRAIINFWETYRILADFWLLVYNSDTSPENVAFGTGRNTVVRIQHLFELFNSIAESND
jgi:predicted ABC-type ATPase